MNRDELERKIAEASEGELTAADLAELENELIKWPDLKQDFEAIMNLPDIGRAYPVAEIQKFSSQIDTIRRQIREQDHTKDHFSEFSLFIFKKYALAASILIVAGSSALFFSDDSFVNSQETVPAEELFVYQAEAAASEDYMVQIDNLLFDENSDEY